MADIERVLRSPHTWRAVAAAAGGVVSGIGAVRTGLPPHEASVFGWQTATTLWGYVNGWAKNLGGPVVVGGVAAYTAAEYNFPEAFGHTTTGVNVVAGGFLGWVSRRVINSAFSSKKPGK